MVSVGVVGDDNKLYKFSAIALGNLTQPHPVNPDCFHEWEHTGIRAAMGYIFKCRKCKSTTLNPSAYAGRRIWDS